MSKDALLVLGASLSPEGEMLPRTLNRMQRAVELYGDDNVANMIISGRLSSHIDYIPSRTEAEAMKEYAVQHGVPEERIFLEQLSRETIGNLFFSKQLYLAPRGWHDIVVVTSSYHQERVRILCQKILGKDYRCEVEGADPGYPSDALAKKIEGERLKCEFARQTLAGIPDGDDEKMRDYILNEHKGYVGDQAVQEFLSSDL